MHESPDGASIGETYRPSYSRQARRRYQEVFYETILTREDADRYRAAGWWPDRLLNDALSVAVARYPGRAALVDARGRMTYATLQAQVDQCAFGLVAIGIRHGDVVT